MNIIPAIDMKNGKCVRLMQGDFDRETVYSDDPAAVARQFADMGFQQMHLVDLDGALTGTQKNRDLVRSIVDETKLAVQVGGGIRNRETVASWFDSGVSRVVIGSLAVTDVSLVQTWLQQYGADRMVLALDCRRNPEGTPILTTHGWTRAASINLWQCIETYLATGLRHVLCTDVSRDGALAGPALELYSEFRERYPELQLQASGGVRNIDDLEKLRAIGSASAITGRALLDGCITDREVSSFLRDA
jgi:phosphoribosylformimino-5-aminoimidazole carboxamide ribotide isomerase